MPFTIRLGALSFTYRLLTIALLFLVTGCTSPANTSPANTSPANISHTTPPSHSEWNQLAEDRRFTIRFVSQALWDTRQLVDKKMSRLEIGKLQGDYSELKRLDDSLLQLLMHSITVGNNPAADYSAIHDAMFDWHNKSLNLEVYLKVTSVVPWRGRFGATGQITNNSTITHFRHDLPRGTITAIWSQWQLRQEGQRNRAQTELDDASMPTFETLMKEFGP